MPPRRSLFWAIHWRGISRWCCLGTIVMLLWLLAPVATCSLHAFRTIPLSELDPQTAGREAETHQEDPGFFAKWGASIKHCYRKTPLLEQEPWKRDLLFGFGGLMLLAWALVRIEERRKRSFER